MDLSDKAKENIKSFLIGGSGRLDMGNGAVYIFRFKGWDGDLFISQQYVRFKDINFKCTDELFNICGDLLYQQRHIRRAQDVLYELESLI